MILKKEICAYIIIVIVLVLARINALARMTKALVIKSVSRE